MFTLMLRCGLRISEVSDLKTANLYLEEIPGRIIILGKGNNERTVFLSVGAKQSLVEWLNKRPHTTCEYVFVSYQKRKISTTSISNRMKRIRLRCGINFTAHQLRHSFADQLLSAGMPITSIQKLLGHRFVETTQNYALANDGQVQKDFYEACNRLDGWNLMKQTTLSRDESDGANMGGIIDECEESELPQFEIPKQLSFLPKKLTNKLEKFRQLKAIRWRKERIIPNSKNYYNRHSLMWKYFIARCGVKDVINLRIGHVLGYVTACLDAGSSASTVNNDLSELRSFLSFLRDEKMSIHPSLETIKRLKQTVRLPRYLSADQVSRLDRQIDFEIKLARQKGRKHDARLMQAVFYLLWQGGLRLGEVEHLKFNDFYVSTSVGQKRLFVRDGKWRKGRVVYLTDVTLRALKNYMRVRGQEIVGGYVFIRNSAPLKQGYIRKQLKAIGERMDIHVVPHRLRHTYATQLLNVGCKATSIQKLLGHKSLNTTMNYARALDLNVMNDYLAAMEIIEVKR